LRFRDLRRRIVLDVAVKLAIVAVVGWVLWKTLQPRTAFVITIAKGEPRVTSGKATASLLDEVATVCREHGVQCGRIRGVIRRKGEFSLAFSRGLPPGLQQQIRNAFEWMR
jgi:hypothetical protein